MKLTDRKKSQIIQAAVDEFRDKGFSGTSMDNVAQRADVSKRTVYNHFESKDALFLGIMEYMFGLIAETAPSPYMPEQPLEPQLYCIAKTKIDLFSSDEFLALSRVAIPEFIHKPEKMQAAMGQISTIETDLERWFCAVIDAGHLAVDSPHEACEQFMGLIKMEAFWPRLMKGRPAPANAEKHRMADKAVGMFLCYLRQGSQSFDTQTGHPL